MNKIIPSSFSSRSHRGGRYLVTWLTWRDHLATVGHEDIFDSHTPAKLILTHMWGLKETGKYLSRVSVPSAVWSLSHEPEACGKICLSAELTMQWRAPGLPGGATTLVMGSAVLTCSAQQETRYHLQMARTFLRPLRSSLSMSGLKKQQKQSF